MFVTWPAEQPVQLALSETPAALLQTVEWAAAGRARSSFDDAISEGGVLDETQGNDIRCS